MSRSAGVLNLRINIRVFRIILELSKSNREVAVGVTYSPLNEKKLTWTPTSNASLDLKQGIMRMTRIDCETWGAICLQCDRLIDSPTLLLLGETYNPRRNRARARARSRSRESQRYVLDPSTFKRVKRISSPSIDRDIDVSISRSECQIYLDESVKRIHVSDYFIKGTGSRLYNARDRSISREGNERGFTKKTDRRRTTMSSSDNAVEAVQGGSLQINFVILIRACLYTSAVKRSTRHASNYCKRVATRRETVDDAIE